MAEATATLAPAGIRPTERRIVAVAIVLAVVTLAAQGAYVFAGSTVAANEMRDAARAISTAIAHQDAMQDSFNDLGQNFGWLTKTTDFHTFELRPLADEFVLNWRTDAETIKADDGALQQSGSTLADNSWLTLPSRPRIAHEASRIGHARKALAALGEMAGDLVTDGQFLQAWGNVAADFIKIDDAGRANNEAQLMDAMSMAIADAKTALPLTSGPGLPPEVHSLVRAVLTFASDFRTDQIALDAGTTSLAEANRHLDNDWAALKAVNTDRVPDEINAFFKPYIDRYHAEANAASH